MEASTLSHASRAGILAGRSPLLRLQGDDRLVALIRAGHDRAFEVLFDRYHARLLAFCRNMLRSAEDAEDVLQEVFANAHAAMLGDNRAINVRPWLYRIARNRCLNHLRKPVPEGQDTMDVHPGDGGTTTAERVQTREDFRALVADVRELPETQRTALLLRELDALCYEEIATAMDTTVPAVKSLLVRARMSLAEATHSRVLSCGDVRLELAEAAEGLRKASGPVRHHVRRCEPCRKYRSELRSNERALASLAPAGFIVLLGKLLGLKFGGSGAAAGAGSGAGAAAGGGATLGGAAAAAGGAAGGVGSAIGAKAAVGVATAALLTAGAVEVKKLYSGQPDGAAAAPTAASQWLQGEAKAPAPVAEDQASPASHRSAVTASAKDAPAKDAEPAVAPTTDSAAAESAPPSGGVAAGEETSRGSGGEAATSDAPATGSGGGGTAPAPTTGDSMPMDPPLVSEPSPAPESEDPPPPDPPPAEPGRSSTGAPSEPSFAGPLSLF